MHAKGISTNAKDFEIVDERFRTMILGNAWVEKLHGGMLWAEGPVWFADGQYLLWSDIPNNVILQYCEGAGVRVFRHPSNNTNGHTRDREGRLVSCEHRGRRVSRTELDGSVTVLADRYKGKRLNSPNDVVVKSDGTIWFTDPPYGIMSDYEGKKSKSDIGANYVYRLDPASGALTVVADDFDKPNGIAFSPDEKTLYVADTGGSHDPDGAHHIRAFDVVGGKKLANGRVFAEIDPRPRRRLPPGHRRQRLDLAPATACMSIRAKAICSARSWCRRWCRTSASAGPSATGCSSRRPRRSTPSMSAPAAR